jgi:hypothetical protein
MQHFWTNTIWYILLCITTVIELLYVLLKAQDRRRMFALFLSFSGLAYIIEILIVAVFKGYEYFPLIFHQISPLDDTIMGNIFSQFSIAATALLVSFLGLRRYWYVICALLYGIIEQLFLYLGIYEQHGYATWMTVIGLSILLWVMKKMYQKAFREPGRIFRYVLTLLAVYVPYFLFLSWPFRLLGYPTFNQHLFSDESIVRTVCTLVNFALLFGVIQFAYARRLRWWYQVTVIVAFCAAYYLASMLNIINYKDILLLFIYATIQIFGMYLFLFVVDRLYGFHPSRHRV